MKKKVIIACTRRSVSEFLRIQLEELLGEYADVGMLLVNQKQVGRIRCDLVIAISEEVVKEISPLLIGDTEIMVLHLTIQRKMYERLKGAAGAERAIVVNNTQELALETVALLYALDMKNIELLPYYPGCPTDYPDVTMAITPNEFNIVPDHIKTVIDIGERCLEPLTLIEVFSHLNCLNHDSIEKIFSYGQTVVSVNRGITELMRNGQDFGFSQKQLLEVFDDAVFILDENRKISFLNSSALSIFNNSYDYLLHKNAEELIPELKYYLGREERGQNTALITLLGRSFLLNWRSFAGSPSGGSILVLKDMDDIKGIYARYGRRNNERGEAKYRFQDIIGSSEQTKMMNEKAIRFAKTDFPILIQGESGTGKELLAQAIHQSSNRDKGPFIAFNCAALTESLLESELFGYQEGAFTGANKKGRAGIFEMASGGTLFMDEIGDISLNLQAKILRVLQEQEVVRVGGTQVIPVDIRIISATNQDLKKYVEEKKFRLDLYYRLNTLMLHTIPLRERPKDILEMLPYFFNKNNIKKSIRKDALDFMLKYPWHGNVRELQNCVAYLSVIDCDMIGIEDFPEYMLTDTETIVLNSFNAEPVELQILIELNQCRMEGRKTGRKRLAEVLREKGSGVTEAEVREILKSLQRNKFIEISKGRGGTKITDAGINKIGH